MYVPVGDVSTCVYVRGFDASTLAPLHFAHAYQTCAFGGGRDGERSSDERMECRLVAESAPATGVWFTGGACCTHAYVISHEGASRLAQLVQPLTAPIDEVHSSPFSIPPSPKGAVLSCGGGLPPPKVQPSPRCSPLMPQVQSSHPSPPPRYSPLMRGREGLRNERRAARSTPHYPYPIRALRYFLSLSLLPPHLPCH